MLVVDAHTLQAVNFLNFVHQEGRQFFNTLNGQNVMRRWIAVHDIFALFDHITFLNWQMLALRDEIFNGFQGFIQRHDANAALVFIVAAELDAS